MAEVMRRTSTASPGADAASPPGVVGRHQVPGHPQEWGRADGDTWTSSPFGAVGFGGVAAIASLGQRSICRCGGTGSGLTSTDAVNWAVASSGPPLAIQGSPFLISVASSWTAIERIDAPDTTAREILSLVQRQGYCRTPSPRWTDATGLGQDSPHRRARSIKQLSDLMQSRALLPALPHHDQLNPPTKAAAVGRIDRASGCLAYSRKGQ